MLFILLIYFILIKAPTKLNGIFLPGQNRVLTIIFHHPARALIKAFNCIYRKK